MNNITNTVPLFSIIIPTYNRAELLRRCLNSILSQTFCDWEAVVVDNYSEDNTEEVVKSFNDPRIIYCKNHNYGIISISRNKAIDLSSGKWLCFLDSDDYWLSDKLESIKPFVTEYDIIYHGYRINETNIDIYGNTLKEPYLPNALLLGNPFNPSSTSVSRKILGEIRFNEERDMFAVEDYDFFLKILRKNPRVKHIKSILTVYQLGGVSHDSREFERNSYILTKWISDVDNRYKHEIRKRISFENACNAYYNGNMKQCRIFLMQLFGSYRPIMWMRAMKWILLSYF